MADHACYILTSIFQIQLHVFRGVKKYPLTLYPAAYFIQLQWTAAPWVLRQMTITEMEIICGQLTKHGQLTNHRWATNKAWAIGQSVTIQVL